MTQTIFFLSKLKSGADPAAYEAWVEAVDYPRVRSIDAILEYAETLQALDTEGVPEADHAGEATLLREDAVAPGVARERALEAAPDAADGLFRVPRVIGG